MALPPPPSAVTVQVGAEDVTVLPMRPITAESDGTEHTLRCRVSLINTADRPVVYRWAVSNSERYVVRSTRGVLAAKGGRAPVEILAKHARAAELGEDKFRLSLAWGADAEQRWAEIDRLSAKEARAHVSKRKLTVALSAPDENLADPVAEEEEEEPAQAELEVEVADDPAAWVTARNKGYCVSTTQAGDGCTFPQKGDRVLVHYTGMLREGGTKFASSRSKGGEPFETSVGMAKVIKGWDEGLREMAQGERAVLRVSSDFAYGEKGFGDKVPPKADLVYDIELLAVSPRPSDAKVKAYGDDTKFSVIKRFYEKYDSEKTEQQIRDILAKDKYKDDFSKLCKMLLKKYNEDPAVLWWSEQKLTPAQPKAKAPAPKKDAQEATSFPGASAKISFSAASKAPAFGSWSSQASTAPSGGLFGNSSSTPSFSFTPSASSASAAVGKPAFGAPSVLGLAQPAFGSASSLGSNSSASTAATSVPQFTFAKIGQGFSFSNSGAASSFSFANPGSASSAASSAASSSSFSFKPAPVVGSSASLSSTPPSTAPGTSAFAGASSQGTKLNFSTPGSVATSAGDSPAAGFSPAQDSSDTIPIEEMTVKQVADWIAGVKLEAEGDPFEGHHIDGVALRHLDEAALNRDLSVKRAGDRQAILSAVAVLESAGYDISLPPPTHLQGLFSAATTSTAADTTAAGTASTGFTFSSASSGFSFAPASAPVLAAASTAKPMSTTEDEYSYSSKPGHLRLGDTDRKLESVSAKQVGAFYRHVGKAPASPTIGKPSLSLVNSAVSLLASHDVDGEALVHLTAQTCIEEMDATQALTDFVMGVRDRLVNGPGASTAHPQPLGSTDRLSVEEIRMADYQKGKPAQAAAAGAAAPDAVLPPAAGVPPVQPSAQTAFATGETISALPSSVSGGHCFVSSGGAGILVAHTVGHGGDESLCTRGFANAQINVAQNGAGTATFAFEPGALAVDRRPPVARNAPAAVHTMGRVGGEEMAADARLRELEYNDAIKQNAELKAKVEELGGEAALQARSKKSGEKNEDSGSAARTRSTISCLACGHFNDPNFEIKGAEVHAREHLTCRSSAAVTEGRWYYEVKLLDSAASAKIGFAREGFAPRDRHGVGDDSSSWGFDGANLRKWHGGSKINTTTTCTSCE